MHAVAPRTGPDEINVAEEQHEYRQLLPQAVARPQTGPSPVMSAEDWRDAAAQVERGKDADVHKCVIALGNYALADDDPQRFTHAHVDLLRGLAFDAPDGTEPALLALADLLDNYLPPR